MPRGIMHTKAEIEDVLKALTNGMSVEDVHALTGIPAGTIKQWQRGINLGKLSGNPRKPWGSNRQNTEKETPKPEMTKPHEITLDDVIGALTSHKQTELQLRSDLGTLTSKYNRLMQELQELQSKLNTRL